jgi:tRNA pseudouridine38-40 synthase
MRNIKVTIAYDGTNYFGFQEQRGTRYQTIQGVLEDRLSRLAKKEIRVTGAGRTDSGVHARGQVINFDPGDWTIPAERVAYALNSLLPEDIVALESAEAPPSFHARFSALAKSYRYTIYNGKLKDPFLRLYSYHIPFPLDVEAMREGAGRLPGKHDFSAFRALGTPVKTTVRTLYEARVNRQGDLIYIDLRGGRLPLPYGPHDCRNAHPRGQGPDPAARSGGYSGKPGQLAGGAPPPRPGACAWKGWNTVSAGG